VRHDALWSDEVTLVGGLLVTSHLRTAFDLARRPPSVEAVVAVDALARVGEFDPAELIVMGRRHLGARGSSRLAELIRLANRLSGSPMETRIRLALQAGGVELPVLQHPVGPYLLDLADPDALLAVEYNGRDHLDMRRALRDLDREARLAAAGWKVLRFTTYQVPAGAGGGSGAVASSSPAAALPPPSAAAAGRARSWRTDRCEIRLVVVRSAESPISQRSARVGHRRRHVERDVFGDQRRDRAPREPQVAQLVGHRMVGAELQRAGAEADADPAGPSAHAARQHDTVLRGERRERCGNPHR
jgi:hypothetical protein